MRRISKTILLKICSLLARDCAAKVVFYHDIGQKYTPMGTPGALFWAHMSQLRDGDVVCFDDGFRGVWDERDKLRAVSSKFRVVVFIAVALVGEKGYLTWDEIRELQEEYGVEFQCHTWTHQTLAGPWNTEVRAPHNGRTEDWFRHELVESKVELEHRLGRQVTALCFPVGYFNDDVIRRCKAAGYKQVFASYPGNVTSKYIQPRCLVQNMSTGEFKCLLKGGMNLFCWHYRKLHNID